MVELDDLSTWPKNLTDFLEQHIALFISHADRASEILSMQVPDKWVAKNDFDEANALAYNELNQIVGELTLVCYHATRSIDTELTNVLYHGLWPLSVDSTYKKIDMAYMQEIIDLPLREKLITLDDSSWEYRMGKVYFFVGKNILKKPEFVSNLLKYWGGEAIYERFLEDAAICEVLSTIGTPCIIKAHIPVSELKFTGDLSSTLVKKYRSNKMGLLHTDGLDAYITTTLTPNYIQKMYIEGHSEVAKLTGREEAIIQNEPDLFKKILHRTKNLFNM